MSELDPQEGPPPRHFDAWTRVVGHAPVRDRRRPFCSCGWVAPGQGNAAAVAEHLRLAWPELVPRLDGEGREQWLDRVALLHVEALEDRERAWDRNGMDRPVQPGQAIPVIPQDWARADDRVQVLEHQPIGLSERLGRGPRRWPTAW